MELPTGHSTIVVHIVPGKVEEAKPAEPGQPKRPMPPPFPGSGTLTLNGKEVAHASFLNIPASGGYWSPAESLDIGSDLGSPVSSEYKTPNRFTGVIGTVTLELEESEGLGAKEKAARNDGHS
jgi:arylsulfatase